MKRDREWNSYEQKGDVLVENIPNFSLEDTLLCGQCFRWKKQTDGSFIGIVKGIVGEVLEMSPGNLRFRSCSIETFETLWVHYFDLERDYGEIKRTLKEVDPKMEEVLQCSGGVRLLQQEPWETLVSFVLSSNNTIGNITKAIENLCRRYGKEILWRGNTFYRFPSASELVEATLGDFQSCRTGYRGGYLMEIIKLVNEGGLKLKELERLDYLDLRKCLTSLTGVGPKVADCVALFSFQKYEAYPNDVWIQRVTEMMFLGHKSTKKEIETFAAEHFGKYSGFAQQYLFYYGRCTKMK